ncbi:hypothetical protein [Methylobacterium sp. WL9]|uniref:hypothetical protein n=1 Tax=Methylobacterium sp. WL9 TaxID=2603898 RepID=UPI0011C81D5D|nr:hypothetical protein [Methylobacterium sp. WL9]TXN23989.1 hypothetical protein FV217_04800 [Methylobacterium sp. WL9]
MHPEPETDATPPSEKKRGRKSKHAQPTVQEILDKARREARPSTPAERRRIEAAGQQLLPGHDDLPKHFSTPQPAA